MEKHIRDSFNDEILSLAADKFGVKREDTEFIGGFENLVYSFMKNDMKYILRISHSDHNTFKNFQAELEFVEFLSDNGANVVKPIKSVNSNYVELLGKEEPCFIATAFEFADGNPPEEKDISKDFFKEYGRNIAMLHKISKDFKPLNNRYHWDEEVFVVKAREYLPEEEYKIYDKFIELVEEIKNLPIDNDSYGLMHTDVHLGNFFLTDKGEFQIFDFDDCCYNYYISDIAIVIFYLLWFQPDNVERADYVMKYFMEGYNEVNKLDDFWFENFNLFLKLREIVIFIVIYRSYDINNLPEWTKKYIEMFRPRILEDIPYLDMDYVKYNK